MQSVPVIAFVMCNVLEHASDMDDVVVVHDSSVAQTSQSGHSTITDQSNGTEQKVRFNFALLLHF